MKTKIEMLRNIFQRNDDAARENRTLLDHHGVVCFNLLGGAGSGKTLVLEALLPKLKDSLRIAVLEGDLATTRDSERIARLDVKVIQLLTDGGCHLNATLVQHALERLPLSSLDLIIIENVGNPICPANFDLGEHDRISVLSVAEGDDKPAKYPLLFSKVALVLLTKCDLLPFTDFDPVAALADIRRINPNAMVINVSARKGYGITRVEKWVREYQHRASTFTETRSSQMPSEIESGSARLK